MRVECLACGLAASKPLAHLLSSRIEASIASREHKGERQTSPDSYFYEMLLCSFVLGLLWG